MGRNPEAVVSAYFDALNRSDAQALASLFEEDGEGWRISQYMYNSADVGAGAQ